MTRSTARKIATDWKVWGALLLFVVAILAEVGALPEFMKAVVLGFLVGNFLFSYSKTLRAKFISR